MHISRPVRRLVAVGGVAALAVLATAGPAAAHVTVNPRTAEQGSYAKLSFRVPNERDNAQTTALEVNLPADHAVASVSVRPTPGWTVKVDKSKLTTPIKTKNSEITEAVTRITWSKGSIEAGQFQEFDVSMGPLPTDTNRLVFTAVQTYSNGEVVRWEQDPGAGGQEPEHPAPVLALTAKGSGAAGGQSSPAKATTAGGAADDGTARLLGGVGLALGVVGVAAGGLALARTRSRS